MRFSGIKLFNYLKDDITGEKVEKDSYVRSPYTIQEIVDSVKYSELLSNEIMQKILSNDDYEYDLFEDIEHYKIKFCMDYLIDIAYKNLNPHSENYYYNLAITLLNKPFFSERNLQNLRSIKSIQSYYKYFDFFYPSSIQLIQDYVDPFAELVIQDQLLADESRKIDEDERKQEEIARSFKLKYIKYKNKYLNLKNNIKLY